MVSCSSSFCLIFGAGGYSKLYNLSATGIEPKNFLICTINDPASGRSFSLIISMNYKISTNVSEYIYLIFNKQSFK